MSPIKESTPHPGFGDGARSCEREILESTMHWVEAGEGDPIVMLHGNPTSSFLWRKVFAGLDGKGRLLAPDLIGFGKSGKPALDYSLADHQRYLDAWFDAMDLKDVTLLLQDYGGFFGVDWARRNSDRVKAIAFMEPVLRPVASKDMPPPFIELRGNVLKPGIGEKMVIEDNEFLEAVSRFFIFELPEEDRLEYLKPFPTPESRKPLIVFPRHLPVDPTEGWAKETAELLERNNAWLVTADIPKVLITFEPGFLITKDVIDWCRDNLKNLVIEEGGAGLHFVQEEAPEPIVAAVGRLLDRAAG